MAANYVFLFFYTVWCYAWTGRNTIVDIHTVNSGSIGPFYTTDLLMYAVNMIDFGLNISQLTQFDFEVKACNDVNVYLTSSSEMDSSKPFYELVIGGYSGTKSCIGRRNDDSLSTSSWYAAYPGCKVTGNVMDLPSCSEFRSFWISFGSGLLKIGRVDSDKYEGFLNWTDPDPFPIMNIGMSTSWGASGEWKIVINDNFTGFYKRCAPVDSIPNVRPMDTQNINKAKCAVLCASIEICIGFNFKKEGDICEVLSFSQDIVPLNPKTNISEWMFFSKCGQDRSGCFDC